MANVEFDNEIKFDKRSVYRQKIFMFLKRKILEDSLKAGDKLVETRIAKDLGVSQAPVREAIRDLEAMGFVETVPFKGSYVCEVTPQDMADAYIVRSDLETLALKLAFPLVTTKDVEALSKLLSGMHDAAVAGDMDNYIEYNWLFHEKIMQICNNKTLMRAWKQCHVKELIYLGTKASEERSLVVLADRHQRIIDALIAKDVDMAARESIEHITVFAKNYKEAKEKNMIRIVG